MRGPRVLMIIRRFPPESFGGGELSALTLAKGLRGLGIDLSVLRGRAPDVPAETEGVPVLPRIAPPGDPHDQSAWNRALATALDGLGGSFDLLHVHDPRLVEGAVRWAGRTPVVATVNDLSPTCYFSLHERGGRLCERCSVVGLNACMARWGSNRLGIMLVWRRQRAALAALNALAGILCRSEDVAHILRRNGVRVPMIVNPPAVEEIGYVGDPPGDGRLLYVGRVDRGKGIDVAIEALARVTGPTLRVVGGGPYEQAYRDLARRLGVSHRVEFAGPVDHASLRDELARCDATVIATTRVEPSPRGIFESAFAGRAVVVSDRTGGREYVDRGRTGFVVPAGDVAALARAFRSLTAPGAPLRMGRAAREHILSAYSLERVVADAAALYRRVLDR